MSKFKKITLLTVCALSLNIMSPITTFANTHNHFTTLGQSNSDFTVTRTGDVYLEEQIIHSGQSIIEEKGAILSNYFYVDNRGNIKLSLAAEDLASLLDISVEDANLMIKATSELPNIYSRGFVGLRIHLGPTVRKMNGWAAGTFAAGYCGWHLKQFATTPVTAGFVAVISGGIGLAVKTAVENYVRMAVVGLDVPGIAMSFDVYVP